jgi:hypothetical protein
MAESGTPWRWHCSECGVDAYHEERDEAHGAALTHTADTGHLGSVTVSRAWEVWEAPTDGRRAVRPHRLSIAVRVGPAASRPPT